MNNDDAPRDRATLSIMMTQEIVERAAFDVSRREMLNMIKKVDESLADRGRRRVGQGTFRITFEVETEEASMDATFPRMSVLFVGGPKDGQRELVDKPPPREMADTAGRYVWVSTGKSKPPPGVSLEARYEWRGDTPSD